MDGIPPKPSMHMEAAALENEKISSNSFVVISFMSLLCKS
jgi:hypothetical protein